MSESCIRRNDTQWHEYSQQPRCKNRVQKPAEKCETQIAVGSDANLKSTSVVEADICEVGIWIRRELQRSVQVVLTANTRGCSRLVHCTLNSCSSHGGPKEVRCLQISRFLSFPALLHVCAAFNVTHTESYVLTCSLVMQASAGGRDTRKAAENVV